jgi:putative toxin-antitoxin system antitoxin component (TIGR02293 family)
MIENIQKQLDTEIKNLLTGTEMSREHSETLTYAEFLSDRMLIIEVIRKGIPYSLFHLIQLISPFSEKDWADILDISSKSLQRYKQASRQFKPIQSEKIIEIAEVTNLGMEVFEDMEKFRLWLETPNFSLGNIKPAELMKDSYGKEMVLGELSRINHGILA